MAANFKEKHAELGKKTEAEWTHHVEIQGTLCVWRIHKGHQQSAPPPKGLGTVTGFSRDARFRMLKAFNRINFPEVPYSLFVTLTLPDETCWRSKDQMDVALATFWRRLETYRGEKVSAFWRLEHVPRKTGLWVGQYYPHVHMLIFGVRFIPVKLLFLWWRKSLHVEYARVDVETCTGQKSAAWYVAKYCGKPPTCSLVIDLNRNKCATGKQWGILRRKSLPVAPLYRYVLPQGAIADQVREIVASGRGDVGVDMEASWTILGDLTPLLEKYLREKVDGEVVPAVNWKRR